MKKRCYICKCLEEESTLRFSNRTKVDAKARFFCRLCLKNPDRKKEEPKEEKLIEEVDLMLAALRKKNSNQELTDEECQLVGRFYRKYTSEFIKKSTNLTDGCKGIDKN